MTTRQRGASASRWGLFHHADFRRLWIAETISQFGSQVSLLAIPLVAISLLGASPFQVAFLGTIEFLPFILFSLPAGAWIDRLRRRPILILADIGRATSLAWIPIAWELHVLTIEQLYVIGFLTGVLTVFFDVSYMAYLPSLLERDQIAEGNSLLEISRTVAQTTGPAVGGGLIGLVTAPVAIVADALSFLASASFLGRIRRQESRPDPHLDAHGQPRVGIRREVAQGLRFVMGDRYLRTIAATTAASNLFSNIAFATFLVFVVRDLHLAPGMIGIVLGIGNLGAIIGAFAATRLARRFGVGRVIVGAMAIGSPAALLVPLASHGWAIPLLILAQAIGGFASVVYNVNQVSLRQAITPERMQGRMNATMRFIVWGTIPIGATVGGIIATAMGVTQALWIGSILGCTAFVPVFLGPVRSLRAMPPGSDDDPDDVAVVPAVRGGDAWAAELSTIPSTEAGIMAEAGLSGYEPMLVSQPRAMPSLPGKETGSVPGSGQERGDPGGDGSESEGARDGQDGGREERGLKTACHADSPP